MKTAEKHGSVLVKNVYATYTNSVFIRTQNFSLVYRLEGIPLFFFQRSGVPNRSRAYNIVQRRKYRYYQLSLSTADFAQLLMIR